MTLAIAIDNTEPAPDQLAGLKAERRELQAEAGRLAAAKQRLNDAARGENEAVAALNELSEAEAAAMKKWASAGALGATPQPKTEEREKLTARLAEASAQAAAAMHAAGDIEQKERGIHEKLADLYQRIGFIARGRLVAEFESGLAEFQMVVDEANLKIASVLGLRFWLSGAGNTAQARGDGESASMFFALAQRLAALTTPEFGASKSEISAAGQKWAERYGELMGDGNGGC